MPKPVQFFLAITIIVTVIRAGQYFYVLNFGVSNKAIVINTRGTKGGVMVTYTYAVRGKIYYGQTSYGVFILNKGDTLDIKYMASSPDGFIIVKPRKNMNSL